MLLMTTNQIINRIPRIKKAGANYYIGHCPCPNHEDRHPSFAVYINKDWVNLKCFAGCPEAEILSALGLRKKDLYIGKDR